MAGPQEAVERGEPRVYRDSRAFWASLTAAAAGLAWVSTAIWGWGLVGLVVFGAYALWGGARLADRRVRLEITDTGIVDRTFWFSPGPIPWSEIVDVRSGRLGFIEVEVADEAAFMERLPRLSRLARWKFPIYGLGPAAFSPWPLSRSRADVLEALQAALDAHVLQSTRTAEVRTADPRDESSPP